MACSAGHVDTTTLSQGAATTSLHTHHLPSTTAAATVNRNAHHSLAHWPGVCGTRGQISVCTAETV